LLATGSSLCCRDWFHWQQASFLASGLYTYSSHFYDFLSVVQICTNGSFLWHTFVTFSPFLLQEVCSFQKCWCMAAVLTRLPSGLLFCVNLSKDGTGRSVGQFGNCPQQLRFTGTLSPAWFSSMWLIDTPFLKVTCQQHSASVKFITEDGIV